MKTAENISEKALSGAFYGFLSWTIPISISFLTTRVLVLQVGTEEYGFYSLITGLISYFFVFNTTRAITKHIAANEEKEKLTKLISTNLLVNVTISLLTATLMFLLAGKLVKEILLIETEWQNKVKLGIYIAAFSVTALSFTQIFSAIVLGFQRLDIYSRISVTSGIFLNLGNIVIALRGYGLLTLLLWNSITISLSGLLSFISARKLFPDMELKLNFDMWSLKEALKYGSSTLGYQILSNLLFLFERVLITKNYGGEGVTHYALPMMIAIQIHFFAANLTQFLFPMTSQIEKDLRGIVSLYTKSIRITSLILMFPTTLLILQRNEVITIWLNSSLARECETILLFHLLTYLLITIVGICWQVFDGMGTPQIVFLSYLLSFPISIISMIYLAQSHDIEGIAAGRLIGTVALFLVVLSFEKKMFGKILLSFWVKLIIKLLIVFLCFQTLELLLGKVTFLFVFPVVFPAMILLLGLASKEEIRKLLNFLKWREKK